MSDNIIDSEWVCVSDCWSKKNANDIIANVVSQPLCFRSCLARDNNPACDADYISACLARKKYVELKKKAENEDFQFNQKAALLNAKQQKKI